MCHSSDRLPWEFYSREMFIDKTRAVGTSMGEKDNKKALAERQKKIHDEMIKMGLTDKDDLNMGWESYWKMVNISC